jgi:hypothetical protein
VGFSNFEAVRGPKGGPKPLPRQPRGKFAYQPPVFFVKPELNLFTFRRFGFSTTTRLRFLAAWFRLFCHHRSLRLRLGNYWCARGPALDCGQQAIAYRPASMSASDRTGQRALHVPLGKHKPKRLVPSTEKDCD